MPRNVPESFKQSLELLATLSEADMGRIISALEESPVIESRNVIRDAFLLVAESVSEEKLVELSVLVTAFARINQDRKDEAEATFAELSMGENLSLDTHQRQALKKRLIEISRLPGLVLAARASNEERNHERLLTDSEVMTDLRPLFNADGSQAIVVPWHTLNLRFTSRQYDEDQSESVVMDYSDLVKLRDQINDVLESRVLLQAEMNNRGIPVWDPYVPENATGDEEG